MSVRRSAQDDVFVVSWRCKNQRLLGWLKVTRIRFQSTSIKGYSAIENSRSAARIQDHVSKTFSVVPAGLDFVMSLTAKCLIQIRDKILRAFQSHGEPQQRLW